MPSGIQKQWRNIEAAFSMMKKKKKRRKWFILSKRRVYPVWNITESFQFSSGSPPTPNTHSWMTCPAQTWDLYPQTEEQEFFLFSHSSCLFIQLLLPDSRDTERRQKTHKVIHWSSKTQIMSTINSRKIIITKKLIPESQEGVKNQALCKTRTMRVPSLLLHDLLLSQILELPVRIDRRSSCQPTSLAEQLLASGEAQGFRDILTSLKWELTT